MTPARPLDSLGLSHRPHLSDSTPASLRLRARSSRSHRVAVAPARRWAARRTSSLVSSPGPDSRPLAGRNGGCDGDRRADHAARANGKQRPLHDSLSRWRRAVSRDGAASSAWRPLTFVVSRQADEDRLQRDVAMSPTSSRLQEVVVSARRRGGGNDRPTPGATGRNLSGDQAERLPIDASDLAALAALAPGVVPIGATDSTSTQFSVAGQRPTANNITLDGLTFGGGSIPQDATRTTRIITNTYDVARGQFSGGLVATTTQGRHELARRIVLATRCAIARSSGAAPTPGAFGVAGHAESARRRLRGADRQGQALLLRGGAGSLAQRRSRIAAEREQRNAAPPRHRLRFRRALSRARERAGRSRARGRRRRRPQHEQRLCARAHGLHHQ